MSTSIKIRMTVGQLTNILQDKLIEAENKIKDLPKRQAAYLVEKARFDKLAIEKCKKLTPDGIVCRQGYYMSSIFDNVKSKGEIALVFPIKVSDIGEYPDYFNYDNTLRELNNTIEELTKAIAFLKHGNSDDILTIGGTNGRYSYDSIIKYLS